MTFFNNLAFSYILSYTHKNNLSQREQEVYQHVQNTIEQAYDQVRLLSHNFLPEELEKLRNIAERVKSLGGTWEVTSEKEKGVVNEIVVNV